MCNFLNIPFIMDKQPFFYILSFMLALSTLGHLPAKAVNDTDCYDERVTTLVNQIADNYTPPKSNDREKYYWPKAMARFLKYGTNDVAANQLIAEVATRDAYHFAVLGMARLLYLYANAPELQNNIDGILELALSKELTTSEGTENHITMERTGIFLLSQLALKRNPADSEARRQYDQTREWILTWAQRIYQQGIGEWNSSIYATYSLCGWLNVYDFADDAEVKAAAKAVADYYATEIALHYSWGAMGGPETRGNDEVDLNQTATAYLAWLWFGTTPNCPQGFKANEYIQSIHAVLSSYRPASQIVALARKEEGTRQWYQQAKTSYLYEQPSFCKQDFYVSRNFTLGNLVSAYGGYTGASYAIIPWRLMIRKDDLCPYEIGGGGRYRDAWSGKMRAPFTQSVQHKNTIIIMTKEPANFDAHQQIVSDIINQWKTDWARDWNLRHPDISKDNPVNMVDASKHQPVTYISLPTALNTQTSGKKVYIDAGKVYLIITSLHTPTITTRVQNGRRTVQDKSDAGKLSALALEVIEKDDVASLNELKNATATQALTQQGDDTVLYTTFAGDNLMATHVGNGTCIEPLFDWGYGATEAVCLMTAPPFCQPQWPTGDGFGKIPAFSVNNLPVDYTSPRPVFNGDALMLDGGILRVKTTDNYYVVDYSGDAPLWHEEAATTAVGKRPFVDSTRADIVYRIDGTRAASVGQKGCYIVMKNGKTKKIIERR